MRRRHYALVVAAAALPRLATLLVARGDILAGFTEKSDDFAQVFVASGTYGFVPGEPSAYTQPLYGFFLVPLYWLFGRHWEVVGLAQIAVAAGTAVLVYEVGRRVLSARVGVLAALLATLQPYLLWHDVHVNREILDQLAGVAIVLLTLLAASRRSVPLAAAAGFALGVSILGNSRLLALPLVVAGYLAWRLRDPRRAALAVVALLGVCALTLTPWVVRNKVDVGCFAITTDGRSLWKANNVNTYATLAAGKWIDDVPPLAGAPRLTPEFEYDIYRQTGKVVHVDECAQMRLYEHAVFRFWREHPGAKAKLVAQATGMLWNPIPTKTECGPKAGGGLRQWPEAVYMAALFALAIAGLWLVPAPFAVLALLFLAYETAAAALFAGATRYRISWDFLIALLAAATVDAVLRRRRS